MNRSYKEITDVMGAPLWWDGNAVPRYVPFSPNQTGVYDHAVGLVEIACQECGERFNVAFECPQYRFLREGVEHYERPDPKTLHWGDPPNHDCPAGNTMNCIDLRVIEWWERSPNIFDWIRVPEMEVQIEEPE